MFFIYLCEHLSTGSWRDFFFLFGGHFLGIASSKNDAITMRNFHTSKFRKIIYFYDNRCLLCYRSCFLIEEMRLSSGLVYLERKHDFAITGFSNTKPFYNFELLLCKLRPSIMVLQSPFRRFRINVEILCLLDPLVWK